MTTPMEVRDAASAWPDVDFEVRAVDGGMEFTGYAAVFDSQSEDLGGFREVIRPGAFTRSINAAKNGSADIKAFLNHNMDVVLGSTKAKTLRLTEDVRGLLAEITLPDSVWGHPVAEAVRRGDISSMSFGFSVPNKTSDGRKAETWNDSRTERTIHDVRLYEVSPVTSWPAYKATTASVRSILTLVDWSDEDSVREAADMLTDDQRDTFLRFLNRTARQPFVTPTMADLLARLERKRVA